VLDLGLIGLSQFLPFLCLSLFAGHAADRFDRRLIISLCLAAVLICALLLLLFAAARIGSTLPIFAVLALLGIARAFLAPAAQSILPNMCRSPRFGSAIVLNSSSFQVATIAGPSIGGIVYAFGDSEWVYGSAAGLLLISLLMLLFIKSRPW